VRRGPIALATCLVAAAVAAAPAGAQAPAAQLGLVTQPSGTAASGVPLARQPVVQLQDSAGRAVRRAGVAVTAAIASGDGTLLGRATVRTDSSGIARFAALAIAGVAGERTLRFSSPPLSGALSLAITVGAGPPRRLGVATQPSDTATSRTPFARQPAIQLSDSTGNPVRRAGTDVTASIAGGGGTLRGDPRATTDTAGVAAFRDLAIEGAPGARTLRFAAASLTAVVSAPVRIVTVPAAQLAVTTQPSTMAASGTPFARQPAVQLQDASGGAVRQGGVVVSAGIATGGGVLRGHDTAATDSSGVARFSDLAIAGVEGPRTLRFSAPPLTGALSDSVTLVAGDAGRLMILTQPSETAASGAPFARQPVVQVRDIAGNDVRRGGVRIMASISMGAGEIGGTTTVMTDSTGKATFSDLRITGPVGDRTLLFVASLMAAATSDVVGIIAGAPAGLAVATQPSDTVASGVAFPRQPAVQIEDSIGNPVSRSGVVVTASLASGPGALRGSPTATTDAHGVATFGGLRVTGGPGDRTIAFGARGLGGDTSATLTVPGATPGQTAVRPQRSAPGASPAARLARGIRAYGDLDFDSAATALRGALDSTVAPRLLVSDRVRALAYLGATELYRGNRDSAAAAFARLLQDDPRYRPDQLVFPPEVTSLFQEARLSVRAITVSAPPVTEIASAGDRLIVWLYAASYHPVDVAIRNPGGLPLRQLYSGGVGDSLQILWDGQTDAGIPVETGSYVLRVDSRGSDGAIVRAVELPLDVVRTGGDTLALPLPPADSLMQPERTVAGNGRRALVTGIGAAVAGLVVPPLVAGGSSAMGERFAVVGALAAAGVIGYRLDRESRPIPENIAANRALRAAWQQRRDAAIAENVQRRREARLVIQAGTPHVAELP
jgi:hypothetical protein